MKNIDLKKYYTQFNRKYFGGSLGDYPIQWKTLKNMGAKVEIRGVRNKPSTFEVQRIVFSDFTEFESEEEILGILLHEMIHVEFAENGTRDIGGMHGVIFNSRRKELEKLSGIEIPKEEEISDKSVSSNVKGKPTLAIILFHKQDNKYSLQTYNIKVKDDIISKYQTLPEKWLEKYKIYFIDSDNPNLQKYKIRRKFPKRFSTYPLKKDFALELIQDDIILNILEGFSSKRVKELIEEYLNADK